MRTFTFTFTGTDGRRDGRTWVDVFACNPTTASNARKTSFTSQRPLLTDRLHLVVAVLLRLDLVDVTY